MRRLYQSLRLTDWLVGWVAGWAHQLSAGESRTNTSFQFFVVTITLTDEGLGMKLVVSR
jgi:secreted Zn-dependent insulinase-like peptidase